MFQSVTHAWVGALKGAWIEALELAMRQLAALLHSKYTVRI